MEFTLPITHTGFLHNNASGTGDAAAFPLKSGERGHMKIAFTNLKLSALLETAKFMKFAHYYGIYKKAEKRYEDFKSGIVTFSTVELTNPEEELRQMYIDAVHRAINKLFVLDKAFYRTEKVHIVTRLENFNECLEALREVEEFASAAHTL